MSIILEMKQLEKQNKTFEVPSFIDRKYVEETLEGSTILKQFVDEDAGIYCVVSVYKEDQSDASTMDYYYTRFFAMGDKTVHSFDAHANNLLDFAMKLSDIVNKWFSR